MKYLIINLDVQDGEHRHYHHVLHLTNGKNIEFAAQKYASGYYGLQDGRNDDWWNFDFGCIAVRVKSVHEVCKLEYDRLHQLFL